MKYQPHEEATARYNGNIAEVHWAKATGFNEPTIRRYSYSYDAINRLTNANFTEPNTAFPNNEFYNENMSYDLNGNITQLSRNAPSFYGNYAEQIDELSYEYNGNHLITVNDGSGNPTGYEGGGNPMEYDANGNMLTMPDKYINQIGYNYLNLPNAIGIHENKFKFLYLYRADGTKLRKLTNLTQQDGEFATITEYIDGFHYLTTQGTPDNNTNPVYFAYEQEAFIEEMQLSPNETALRFFPTAEGFYDFENKEYIYQYKDHLGNVRLSFKNDGYQNPIVTDSNDYYPFGMNFVRNSEEDAHFGTGSYYSYKYNGKELQETGMYAMDWRQYMPDIGRFAVQDPLSALIPTVTPYRFAFNNPIYFSDPSGLLEEVAHCPTCPNTPEFKPYIDDPYNVYVYNPETNTASLKVTPIEEVVVTGKKSESNTTTYLGYLNDGIGETGDWLAKNNKGGSIGIWTTPIKNRSFDGITYNKLNVKYYKDGWKWSKSVKTYGVGNYLKKGSVVGQVVLGAIEIGEGAADDYNDYQTKGETNGKNTVVASTKVATGAAAGYVSGAIVSSVITSALVGAGAGSIAPGIGTIIGFGIGIYMGIKASEYAGSKVEEAYNN